MSRPRLAAVLAALALLAPVVRAPAAGAAAPCRGVIVVVDFGHWGDPVKEGCASDPSSGLDALDKAHFATSGTLKQGAAFVCRIDGLPTESEDACVVDPPTTAYWAYYWARPGDASWHYADTGAAGRTPPASTIDAWAFGDNAMPRISPAAFPRSAPPATQPTPAQPSGAADSRVVPPPGGGAVTPAPTTPGATAPRSSPTSAAATGTSAGGTPTSAGDRGAARGPRSTTTTTAVRVIDRAAAPRRVDTDSGSPWPILLALLLLAALGTGAFFVIRARRAQSG